MIWKCALRWAAVLALVAMVALAPLPARFAAPVTSALAQDAAVDAGEPADLAIAALHCAEAPETEALTTFFTTGTAPGGCSPAVGVTISVSEDGAPVSSSPAATDVNGIVVLPVSPGSTLEVREDPASLPDGYVPLAQEANGVPYANPVQIDSAVAGAAVLFVNVPRAAAASLAQEAPASETDAPTGLAVLALQCAAAPAAAALTSYFSTGTPPSGCAPAKGVRLAVTQNAQPVSGSPFTTGADGALSVPVALGAAVSVSEDLASLPDGYAPLTQTANGVPYANPVQLDSATADTAVLFVNVPASVAATLASDPPAVGGTNLAQSAAPDRSGCDPAYPDARTCIAPGRPLAVPCSITDQRNFTVLAPDPRGLDADHDGIGCEPIAVAGGTVARDASVNPAGSGGAVLRAAPVVSGGDAVPASRERADAVAWEAAPASRRADTLAVPRNWGNAGLWNATPARTGTGNVAIVSHPTFIATGVWCWPNQISRDDWIWRQRHLRQGGVGFLPSSPSVNNPTGAGTGNVAIVSNPVSISNGLWAWPERNLGDDWAWRNHAGNGVWSWPDWFTIGKVTAASSGSGYGNVAIVSNPVFIGRGVWHWPGHANAGGWPGIISTGNLVIARSGANIAIVSNPVVIIARGLWYVPPARNHGDDWYDHDDYWDDHHDRNDDDHHGDGGHHDDGDDRDHDDADIHLMQGGSAQAERTDGEARAINGDSASDAPSEAAPLAASEQPVVTVNGGLAVEPAPADSPQPPGDAAVAAPTEGDPAASDSGAALPGDGAVESPDDGTGAAPLGTPAQPQPAADAPVDEYVAPEPDYVAPEPAVDPAYVDPGYIDPAYVDSGYVEQSPAAVDPTYVDPGYVASEPSYVDPSVADPGAGADWNVDPGSIAPDPVFVPDVSEPQLGAVDPGFGSNDTPPAPTYVEQEPAYVAPEPNYGDPGIGAANAGLDAGFGGQNANAIAPEPNIAVPGMDAGYSDAGNGGAGGGNMAPAPGMNDASNADAGGGAAELGNGNGDNGGNGGG
ncbi:MAG: hypothetical protein U0Z70_13915 [Thermomicrobiales bacterium]